MSITDKNISSIQSENIENVLNHFSDNGFSKIANELHKNIYDNESNKGNSGYKYEALLYSCLLHNKIPFTPQVDISAEECFKENPYTADGKLFDNIIFDVKKMGFGISNIHQLEQKLQEYFPDHVIVISGSEDISSACIEYLFKHIDMIKEKLMSNKIYTDYILKKPIRGLKIRAYSKASKIFYTFSYSDPYEWAQNNEFFFLKDSSQFCKNAPYIIFCPFDQNTSSSFSLKNDYDCNTYFRALCRRIFIRLNCIHGDYISHYDGKSQDKIRISEAIKKLSGICFLDVTDNYDYEKQRAWLYLNPNAENKLPKDKFRNHFNILVDSFEYDNY